MAQVFAAALWEAAFADAAVFFLANASTINTALFIGATAAHGAEQRRKLRNQARDAFNASLQDRQVTIRSAVASRGVLYGRDKVGGQLADAFVTGSLGQYLHLVIAFYGHECDACEKIYLNNIELPAPDGSGFIQSGVYAKINTLSAVAVDSSGSVVLPFTPSAITSVTRTDGNNSVDYTVSGADYTLSGSTVTFVGGAVGSGSFYTVNYEYQQVLPRVRVKVHLGQSGQTADSDLVSESGGRWTSNDVGQGIAYIYFRLEYDQDIFGQIGVPEPTALWRGKKVFDPRSSTTVWSLNAALCTRDHLRDTVYGLGCTSAEVPDSEINTAANICDEEVTLYATGTVAVTNGSAAVVGSGTSWLANAYPGLLFVSTDGTRYTVLSVTDNTHLTLTANYGGSTLSGQAYSLRQYRYTCNGTLGTEDSPRENLRKLVATMAGTAVWVQGRWLVRAGAHLTPTLTLNEDYLADGTINITPRASRRDAFNRVSGTFLDANALHAQKQYPAVANATYKGYDGGVELTREISFPLVTDSFRAQRLAKIALERARRAITVRLNCNHRAYDLVPSDTVNLTLARYGWSSKVFEVRSRKYMPGVGIEYTLVETDSGVWGWTYGSDAQAYNPSSATSLPNPFTAPSALASLAVDSGATVNALLATAGNVRALVSWTQSSDIFVRAGGRIDVEWKLWNDTDWQKAPPVPGDATSTYISPLAPRSVTLVRVRPVNAAGRAGPYTTLAHSVATGGAPGGGNVLRNSDFDIDSNADGLADNWTGYNAGTVGTVTYTVSTGGVASGMYQRVQASNLGVGSGNQVGIRHTDAINVDGYDGTRVTLSGFAYNNGSGSPDLRLHIDWYSAANGGGSLLSATTKTVSDLVAGWNRYAVDGVIPSNALSAKVYVWIENRKSSSGAVDVGFDRIQMQYGVLTDYAPRADELLPGVVTTPILGSNAATNVYTATHVSTAGWSSSE